MTRFFSAARVLYNISFISEDLPLPDTPVTHTIFPSGISTSMFLRLFSLAPRITRLLPFPARRDAGTGICFFPLRYCPVADSGHAQISSMLPAATTLPPFTPAPGPISTI